MKQNLIYNLYYIILSFMPKHKSEDYKLNAQITLVDSFFYL
jgi:hypothetical protein